MKIAFDDGRMDLPPKAVHRYVPAAPVPPGMGWSVKDTILVAITAPLWVPILLFVAYTLEGENPFHR